jgi:hypothetical protein
MTPTTIKTIPADIVVSLSLALTIVPDAEQLCLTRFQLIFRFGDSCWCCAACRIAAFLFICFSSCSCCKSANFVFLQISCLLLLFKDTKACLARLCRTFAVVFLSCFVSFVSIIVGGVWLLDVPSAGTTTIDASLGLLMIRTPRERLSLANDPLATISHDSRYVGDTSSSSYLPSKN